jgi:hypothetical protein
MQEDRMMQDDESFMQHMLRYVVQYNYRNLDPLKKRNESSLTTSHPASDKLN